MNRMCMYTAGMAQTRELPRGDCWWRKRKRKCQKQEGNNWIRARCCRWEYGVDVYIHTHIHTHAYEHMYTWSYLYSHIHVFIHESYDWDLGNPMTFDPDDSDCYPLHVFMQYIHVCRVRISCVVIHYIHEYRVAKTHRMSYLYRSFSAKEPCN